MLLLKSLLKGSGANFYRIFLLAQFNLMLYEKSDLTLEKKRSNQRFFIAFTLLTSLHRCLVRFCISLVPLGFAHFLLYAAALLLYFLVIVMSMRLRQCPLDLDWLV